MIQGIELGENSMRLFKEAITEPTEQYNQVCNWHKRLRLTHFLKNHIIVYGTAGGMKTSVSDTWKHKLSFQRKTLPITGCLSS